MKLLRQNMELIVCLLGLLCLISCSDDDIDNDMQPTNKSQGCTLLSFELQANDNPIFLLDDTTVPLKWTNRSLK